MAEQPSEFVEANKLNVVDLGGASSAKEEISPASSFTTFLVPQSPQEQKQSKLRILNEKLNDDRTRALPPPHSITQFSQLQVATNLNAPPSNWLHSIPSG